MDKIEQAARVAFKTNHDVNSILEILEAAEHFELLAERNKICATINVMVEALKSLRDGPYIFHPDYCKMIEEALAGSAVRDEADRIRKLEDIAKAAREYINSLNMSRCISPQEIALVRALAELERAVEKGGVANANKKKLSSPN